MLHVVSWVYIMKSLKYINPQIILCCMLYHGYIYWWFRLVTLVNPCSTPWPCCRPSVRGRTVWPPLSCWPCRPASLPPPRRPSSSWLLAVRQVCVTGHVCSNRIIWFSLETRLALFITDPPATRLTSWFKRKLIDTWQADVHKSRGSVDISGGQQPVLGP